MDNIKKVSGTPGDLKADTQVAMTPLMRQYHDIKAQYQNEVLFFRLGDFYEMFDTDAVEVSRLLNLTLTHRGNNPMCGIPFHASRVYIARLLRLGKKIAICEQIRLPPGGKGIAERQVVEVITPGTVTDDEYLEQNTNNFLAALCTVNQSNYLSYAYIDISTGVFFTTSLHSDDVYEELAKELGRSSPRELLLSRSLWDNQDICRITEQFPSTSVSYEDDWHFSLETSYKALIRQFKTNNLRSFSLEPQSPEVAAAGYLLNYAVKNNGLSHKDSVLEHIKTLKVYKDCDYIILDSSSRRNLELTANIRDGTMQYSLLETVCHTKTAPGSRLLRNFFMYPSTSIREITRRQNHVKACIEHQVILHTVRIDLSHILDIERLVSRIALARAHAKDVQSLRISLQYWLDIRSKTEGLPGSPFADAFCAKDTEIAKSISELIASAILDDPSTSLTEGRIIKAGWSAELDRYRELQENFNRILNEYLEEEKQKTGIPNLKIRYNRNIGYYMEVTRGKLDFVPEHFILRRALVNGDRYTSIRLQELEQDLKSADEKIIETEQALFLELRSKLTCYTDYLLSVATEIAYIDTVASFAHSAITHNWVCPELDESTILDIEGGRHPVVEMHLPSFEFVPNDSFFDEKYFALVTGPNMAGKSTYLRQNALIVFLAQIGSFVPAQRARIGITDKIFCRVGASDNLARGESTFLVEMSETALIVRSATAQSLIIMDEVGRGTSTEDGLAIAWAVSEYLLNTVKARTFFATHYHELTRIVHPKLQLLCLQVQEHREHILFTKKICEGASENSYGVHVARLAGIPDEIIRRAQDILESLQNKVTWTELPLPDTITTPNTEQHPVKQNLSPQGLFSE
ncbi:MAG: DNA mismatch repair protein MutS, partial [Spirochaetales bacterium]